MTDLTDWFKKSSIHVIEISEHYREKRNSNQRMKNKLYFSEGGYYIGHSSILELYSNIICERLIF